MSSIDIAYWVLAAVLFALGIVIGYVFAPRRLFPIEGGFAGYYGGSTYGDIAASKSVFIRKNGKWIEFKRVDAS